MIAVIADTHMPKGQRQLPEACIEQIRAAEALIHAGDFSAASVLAQLRELCRRRPALRTPLARVGKRQSANN